MKNIKLRKVLAFGLILILTISTNLSYSPNGLLQIGTNRIYANVIPSSRVILQTTSGNSYGFSTGGYGYSDYSYDTTTKTFVLDGVSNTATFLPFSQYTKVYYYINADHSTIGMYYAPYKSDSVNYQYNLYNCMLGSINNNMPSISLIAPVENGTYNENSAILTPTISVSDIDNDGLTCKLFIDAETSPRDIKTVTNTATAKNVAFTAMSVISLMAGNHSFRFEVSDDIGTSTYTANITVQLSSGAVQAQDIYYYYDKYQTLYSLTWNRLTTSATKTGYESYTFDSSNGKLSVAGNIVTKTPTENYDYVYNIDSTTGQVYRTFMYMDIREEKPSIVHIYRENPIINASKTTMLESNKIALNGTYPNNGAYSDYYWYVKKSPANYCPAIISSTPTPTQNVIYGPYDIAVAPTMKVLDSENNTLTCTYYIDSESTPRETRTVSNTINAQTVAFNAINIGALTEGSHFITFKVNDGIGTTVSKVNFTVDKTAPTQGTITSTSTVNSISITGSASDSVAGLDVNPYRYTVSTKSPTAWTTATSYTQNSLIPNTNYSVTFESKDKSGNISSSVRNIFTKAAAPSIAISNPASFTLDLAISDNNPTTTQYQILANNSQYVTAEGTLTASPAWVTLSQKKIIINNLMPTTNYTFQIKAINGNGIETAWSSVASGTTLVAPPVAPINTIAKATSNSITVAWDPVAGSTGYDIEVDGKIIDNGTYTTYTHENLVPFTQHTYRVRAKNAGGVGAWSDLISKYTEQNNPNTPFNIDAAANNTSIIVTWKPIPGATAYDIEADGVVINNYSSTNYVHSGLIPGTMHSYRVRSINSAGKSEWSNEILVSTQLETPATPSNVTTFASGDCITVTWNPVQGATYEIEADGSIKDNGTSSTFVHSGLANGSTHTYRVRAKQSGSISDWSAYATATLPIAEFGTPSNIKTEATDTTVVLSWNPVIEAIGYDVEVNGVVTDNGIETSCLFSSLSQNTPHIYRVRAKGIDKLSEWSEYKPVMTYALQTPTNLTTFATGDSISITWNEVPGAESYDLDIDGQLIQDITTIEYIHSLIDKNIQHSYKVRAKNTTGFSAWSKAVSQIPQIGGSNAPTGVMAKSLTNSIQMLWRPMPEATSYDIEVDGTIVQDITDTNYTHNGLEPGTQHNYRIRAVTNGVQSEWSNTAMVLTLSIAPPTPTNVTASSTTSSVLITWDKIEDTTAYELEVDGQIIDTGINTKYMHSSLAPDNSHTYRVRAKNISDWSLWSEALTIKTKSSVQTYDIQAINGQVFNIVLTANDIKDPSKYTYTITYNADELEVLDLCAATSRIDMAMGGVVGADIQIVQYTPGTIVFKKLGTLAGQAWTGQINSIKFRCKSENTTQVIYSFE